MTRELERLLKQPLIMTTERDYTQKGIPLQYCIGLQTTNFEEAQSLKSQIESKLAQADFQNKERMCSKCGKHKSSWANNRNDDVWCSKCITDVVRIEQNQELSQLRPIVQALREIKHYCQYTSHYQCDCHRFWRKVQSILDTTEDKNREVKQ